MICRARPKYIKKTYKDFIDYYYSNADMNSGCEADKYYYNGGSNALEHFLSCYNSYYNKKARVAVQTFTCVSVLNAVINSGSVALLYDVSKEDCSIDYDLIDFEIPMDILIITHYQGIPNKSYLKFAEKCKEKNIILLDDLSHGTDSIIDNIKLGSLSNVYIESYAWDKPYTCLYGGSLFINEIASRFRDFYENEYSKLDQESEFRAKKDIKLIYFLLNYTRPEYYYLDFDYALFFSFRLLKYMYSPIFFRLKIYRMFLMFFYKVMNKLSFLNTKNEILKMAEVKKCFLNFQRDDNILSSKLLPHIPEKYKADCFLFDNERMNIIWNRFSLIDYEGKLKTYFSELDMSADNFNWPSCVHEYIKNDKVNCYYMTDFFNSEYLKNHILNVPIWHIK